MFFPLSVKDVVRDPFDPSGRIDREISDRSRRLALGTCLSDDLSSVTSALVVATGKGKYLRILNAITTKHPLPDFTQQLLRQTAIGDEYPALEDLLTIQSDIALVQASAIEELKCFAGKYVDRLLAISVTQPDRFLQRATNTSLSPIQYTDPHNLAEQTGLSVISSFANRDILAGGNGQNLDALPAWILFSDRHQRIASTNRVLFIVGQMARAFFLPASDGIDNDLPDIRVASCPGMSRFQDINENEKIELDQFNQLNLAGTECDPDTNGCLLKLYNASEISKADYVRSSVVQIVDQLSNQIKQQLPRSRTIDEIVVATAPQIMGTFANQFRRNWPGANVYDGFGWDGCDNHLEPILSATLGILCVDQLPANIPWITGAQSQKVLGRLTPGSPANWRQLLRDMADFQPPVMRLRDAV